MRFIIYNEVLMFNNDKLHAIVQLIAVGGLVVALIMSILWD